jgi:hypothetical protein
MDTFFASPEKADPNELIIEIEAVKKSPVIKSLLHSIGGLLAILNEHRQVVALNDFFLNLKGGKHDNSGCYQEKGKTGPAG